MQGTMPGARRRGRPRTAWMDNIKTWTDRTLRGRVNQNDRGQGLMEKVRQWCGQPSDRGQLKNRTELRKCAVVSTRRCTPAVTHPEQGFKWKVRGGGTVLYGLGPIYSRGPLIAKVGPFLYRLVNSRKLKLLSDCV